MDDGASESGNKKKSGTTSLESHSGLECHSAYDSLLDNQLSGQVSGALSIGRIIIDQFRQGSNGHAETGILSNKELPDNLADLIEDYSTRVDDISKIEVDFSVASSENGLVQMFHDLNIVHAEIILHLGSYLDLLKSERNGLYNRLTAVVAYLEQGLPAEVRSRRPR